MCKSLFKPDIPAPPPPPPAPVQVLPPAPVTEAPRTAQAKAAPVARKKVAGGGAVNQGRQFRNDLNVTPTVNLNV